MREAGLDPDAWLARPAHSAALGTVILRLLDEADRLCARDGSGIAKLPASSRPGINAARHLYAAIGHAVARRGFDAVSGRAVVSPARAARLLFASTTGSLLTRRHLQSEPPLAATSYLVDAAAGTSIGVKGAALPRWNIAARAIWILELFERLERQDHETSAMRWRFAADLSNGVAHGTGR